MAAKTFFNVLLLLLTVSSLSFAFTVRHHAAPTTITTTQGLARTPRREMMLMPENLEVLCSTYSCCLDEHQLPTQSVTAGLFSGTGDILAQFTDEKKKPYDVRRTYNFMLKGLGGGIMWGYWFQVADSLSLQITEGILPRNGGGSADIEHAIRVAVCILLDQFLVCPVFYTLWDIPVPALLSGSPVRQLPAQVASKLGPMLMANAKIWTPANLITYNLAPEFRVLFAGVTDLVWQVTSSQITSNEIVINDTKQQPETIVADLALEAAVSQEDSSAAQQQGIRQGGLEVV